nr:unnamed protein product [Digitaria exilis]
MGIAEVALHTMPGAFAAHSPAYNLPHGADARRRKRNTNSVSNARALQGLLKIPRLRSVQLQCQRIDDLARVTEGNGTWVKDAMNNASQVLGDASVPDQAVGGNGSLNGNTNKPPPQRRKTSSVDDEAWELLQESMVYYCGSPVGTIAANDPNDSDPMNYDQVFIRDFIPSGIAFLLKGEYEIVRNFILHTLQLQTMDCHSPGQGLMPASFKVRTIPLDGDEDATEEVLDPDFGEAAIGRVAPVDSGLWWIILLRAYGKCSGDLSVQERIDVQTGMKMILKLCLADGFDMFPTLLIMEFFH